jgi:hypothetical protein
MVFGLLLFFCIFLYLRIYIRERKATQAFFLLSIIASFFTILSIELWGIGAIESAEFGVGIHLLFASILVVTGLVALMEEITSTANKLGILAEKLKKSLMISENRIRKN